SDDEVERLSRSLTEEFRGSTVSVAREAARDRAGTPSDLDRSIFERLDVALASIQEAVEAEHVLLGGVSNIAAEAVFNQRESLQRIYQALERESAILRLLREAATSPPVAVTIGRENPVPDMWETSIVAAPFGGASGALGTIGVVGPTRMDYAAAIS